MPNLTVPVPDDRTAEFYQFFGLWLAGALDLTRAGGEAPAGTSRGPGDLPAAPEADLTPWGSTEQDVADATTLWKKYSPRARAMFSLLIDNPGKEYTGVEIAEAADIPNGAHGVAGVLAWPGRHGWSVGRGLPTEHREDPETEQGYYWVPADRAEVFKAARAKVEGTD